MPKDSKIPCRAEASPPSQAICISHTGIQESVLHEMVTIRTHQAAPA